MAYTHTHTHTLSSRTKVCNGGSHAILLQAKARPVRTFREGSIAVVPEQHGGHKVTGNEQVLPAITVQVTVKAKPQPTTAQA